MPGMNLTRNEAAARRDTIKPRAYRVFLDLTGTGDTFTSVTEIDFSATAGASTFLDLVARSVESVELNGTALSPDLYADYRFPLESLEEQNTVRIAATMEYSRTGEGMHRYVDPADGETYLYSQFEVPDARRVFATFEQPDLKARFTFTVDAPSQWRVFSNYPAERTESIDGATRWFFQETPPLATYVTAVVAGPYEGAGDHYLTSIDGRTIPLGVWGRKSLAKYLAIDEILEITRQGFAFYEDNYGHPYPFTKYDQVFVPEFNAGAMENAGLVTIVENYVFRDRPNGFVVDRRTITILHELAHMWFGNLVTMRWWDDLWLNESFAEYMSHLAAFEATRWKNAWTIFYASEKVNALAQDQLPSTHPVAADIHDLEDVQVNFDQITYGKGASALKQLVAWVGKEAFHVGVRAYIDKYKWSNATLSDLLYELELASGRDLHEWSKVWIEEAGVNTLYPEIEMEGDRIAKFTVIQDCDAHASLRPHHIKIVGFDEDASGKMLASSSVSVDVIGQRTVIDAFAGQPRPKIILINGDDLTYAKIRLDEASLETALSTLASFEAPLARAQILFFVWDMCRDGEYGATDFARLAISAFAIESDGTVLRVMQRSLSNAVKLYSAPAHRAALQEEIADAAFAIADTTDPGSDRQLQIAGLAITLACSPAQLERIAGWLDGRDVPEGYIVDAAQRWLIVQALAAAGRISMSEIKAEYQRDTNAHGQIAAARAEGAIPDADVRARVWNEILEGSSSNARLRSLCEGMTQAHPASVASYAAQYFDVAESQWERHSVEIAQTILQLACPTQIAGLDELGVDLVGLGETWLAEHRDAPPACYRLVSEAVDRARRAVKAQATDAASRDAAS